MRPLLALRALRTFFFYNVMEKLAMRTERKSAMRFILKSKIHRATVTGADKDYEGSLTVDASLLEAADILPYEQVHVWDVTRGTRLLTYAISGEPGSGTICVNGAGAHLIHPGDLVIIATFTEMEEKAARGHRPKIVLVDENNHARSAAKKTS
jgi:aspartate 1-decarboxylase